MQRFLIGILLLAGAGTVVAATHDVAVEGLAFVPADLTIDQGDTVRWTHDLSSLTHTITSGTDAGDPEAGLLFDQTFAAPGQVFEFTFGTAGVQPYFCRPHVGLGMTGIIRVSEPMANEESSWGRIKRLYD